MAALLKKASILEDEADLELLTLDAICLKQYGPEYITWESETLKEALEDDFSVLGELTWQKIQAVRLLHANSSAWEEWEVFEKICAAVSNEHVVFSLSNPPDPEDIAITLTIMEKIADHKYHKDTLGYIAASCLYDGLWCLPYPLSISQQEIIEHDTFRGIERDYASVRRVLAGRDKLIISPENAAECQANRVIIVNMAVKEYEQKETNETDALTGNKK